MSESLSTNCMPPTASPDEITDLAEWRTRISTRQMAATSSDRRRELSERRERCRTLARQGEQAQRLSQVSRAAFLGSCSSISATSAAPVRSAALTMAFGEAAAPQSAEQARLRTVAATEAMETLQQASTLNRVEEGDEAIDRALNQLSVAGYSFAASGGVGAEAAAEIADASLEDLLASLKQEPSTDEDRAARFALYERHAETVAVVRRSLLQFWESAAKEVTDPAPRAAIDEQIQKIDERSHLELREDPRYWFVYSMANATARNEAAIQTVLKAIQAKIVLLAEEGNDCPICLEPMLVHDDGGENASVIALGCAHKLHTDCWRHWSAHCSSVHKAPFCPTCRNEEFLEEIL